MSKEQERRQQLMADNAALSEQQQREAFAAAIAQQSRRPNGRASAFPQSGSQNLTRMGGMAEAGRYVEAEEAPEGASPLARYMANRQSDISQ